MIDWSVQFQLQAISDSKHPTSINNKTQSITLRSKSKKL